MLIPLTVILILLLIVGVPVSIKLITYKPKEITYLSPEAFDMKMRELEAVRLDSIDRANSQEDIDNANATLDTLKSCYKIRR